MFNFFSQPYPVNEKTFRQNLITSFFEGLFVAAFLVVLKPFGVASVEVVANKNLILASYGLITTLASFLFKSLRAKLFSAVLLENQWTVGYEILANLLFLVFLAFCNTFYTKILFAAQMGFNDYLNMLLMVVLIGIFPTTFGVLWNYINELKKYNRPFEIKHEEVLVPTSQTKLKIVAENEKDFPRSSRSLIIPL